MIRTDATVGKLEGLIQIHRRFAPATAPCPPEEQGSAMGALVALYLCLDPLLRSHLAPLGHGPQDLFDPGRTTPEG